MGDAIAVRRLRKSFGSTEVLRGVDLTVAEGTVFALLGPNGAGKTTLINILSTLLEPDDGTATVAGFDVMRDAAQVRRRISVTGQFAAVDEVLTGRENLRMMGRLSGLGSRAAAARADDLLDHFDLADVAGARVGTYSGGMRRRLDIALSLVLSLPVLFLDEPTTGLDTRSRQALWDEIGVLAASGTTVLLTTQYLDEADQLADRIAVIDRGLVVAEGTADELKAEVGGALVVVRSASGAVLSERPTDGTIAGVRDALAAMDGTADAVVELRTPSLDDVFLAVTGSDRAIAVDGSAS